MAKTMEMATISVIQGKKVTSLTPQDKQKKKHIISTINSLRIRSSANGISSTLG